MYRFNNMIDTKQWQRDRANNGIRNRRSIQYLEMEKNLGRKLENGKKLENWKLINVGRNV